MFLEFERNCLKSCQSGDLKLAFKLGAIWESVEGDLSPAQGNFILHQKPGAARLKGTYVVF